MLLLSGGGGGGDGGGGGAPAPGALDFEQHLLSLPLDDATRRALRAAQAKATEDLAATGLGRLTTLRPAAGVGPWATDAEVLQNIAKVLGGTIEDIAKELAVARGFDPPATSIFFADTNSRVESAIVDWLALYDAATSMSELGVPLGRGGNIDYRDPPASWQEASQRMAAVVEVARRTKIARGNATTTPSPAGHSADDNKTGWFKTVPSASKVDFGFAAGGDMLTPIATVEFARAESVATRGNSALTEVRRLVDMPGLAGKAAFAYIFSAGCAKGAMPKGIAASVVDARAQLLVWLESKIEVLVGEKRIDVASDRITALASAIVCLRATKDGKVDEATCLYPLATYLLGGTLPADEDGTDHDTVGQGTWGVRTGVQSVVDIPTAMAPLSRLLAAVHGLAGGGAMGTAGLAAGADGFGLTAMAKRACGSLTPDKVEEAMGDLFARAQNVLARARTRVDVPRLDWPALVEALLKRKVVPLVNELRAEGAVDRRFAEGAAVRGRKSPRPEDDGAGDDGGQKKLSRREQKKADFVEKKKEQAAGQKRPAPVKPAPVKAAADAARAVLQLAAQVPGLDLAPSSIACLASKANHNGAIEALAKLYVARHPTRVTREQQPCPFVAIRHGTSAASDEVCKDGAEKGKCAQCDGWRDTPQQDRVPFEPCDVAAVKAACTPGIQKIFARMSID